MVETSDVSATEVQLDDTEGVALNGESSDAPAEDMPAEVTMEDGSSDEPAEDIPAEVTAADHAADDDMPMDNDDDAPCSGPIAMEERELNEEATVESLVSSQAVAQAARLSMHSMGCSPIRFAEEDDAESDATKHGPAAPRLSTHSMGCSPVKELLGDAGVGGHDDDGNYNDFDDHDDGFGGDDDFGGDESTQVPAAGDDECTQVPAASGAGASLASMTEPRAVEAPKPKRKTGKRKAEVEKLGVLPAETARDRKSVV